MHRTTPSAPAPASRAEPDPCAALIQQLQAQPDIAPQFARYVADQYAEYLTEDEVDAAITGTTTPQALAYRAASRKATQETGPGARNEQWGERWGALMQATLSTMLDHLRSLTA